MHPIWEHPNILKKQNKRKPRNCLFGAVNFQGPEIPGGIPTVLLFQVHIFMDE